MRILLFGLATILGAAGALAQQQPRPTPGARELFFAGVAPKDDLPPVRHAAPAKAAATAGTTAGAMHLGLRYSLLMVESRGDRGQPVEAERNFRKGDCVAVELEANRSGYLYVLSKQSNGDWIPLFPTPELSDQSNRIDPGQVIRTPRHTCFEIDDPPGTETLFVVLARDPRDIYELSDSIQGRQGDRPSTAGTQLADAGRINSAVGRISEQYGTRDLPFRQVVKPAAQPNPARKAPGANKAALENAVYVVNGSNKPSSTLVTKVEIRHED